MTIPAIDVRGVCRTFTSGGKPLTVLDNIDLQIEGGDFIAILGPSGSGKSTLLALMAGLDRPSSGTVSLSGTQIQHLNEDRLAKLRREKIGFIFQSFQLLGNLTAIENVMLPMEMLGMSKPAARAREILGRVGLAERTTHYPSQLSGGEQQRVAIARAFGTRPAVLLADEPTGNLDSASGKKVLDLLLELREHHQTTMVLVTHDPSVASLARERIYLAAGRIDRREADTKPAAEHPEADDTGRQAEADRVSVKDQPAEALR